MENPIRLKQQSQLEKKRLKRQRNQQLLEGGVLLEATGKACVIHPNIATNKYSSSDQYVSKVMDNEESNKEQNAVTKSKLEILDPNGDYFIYPVEFNKDFSKMTVKQKDELLRCRVMRQSDATASSINNILKYDYTNIVIPYGGDDMQKHRINHMDELPTSMVPQYLYVFLGLCLLSRHGIVHKDIKPQNLLNRDDVIKITDIGLMKALDDDIHDDHVEDADYFIWPIELDIISLEFRQHMKKEIRKADKDTPALQTMMAYIKKRVENTFYTKHSSPTDEVIRHIYSTYCQLATRHYFLNIDGYTQGQIIEECYKKFDVYSLGVTLGIELQLLKNNIGDDAKEQKLYDDMTELVKHMTEGDPFKRITIYKATEKYANILLENGMDDESFDSVADKFNEITGETLNRL